MVHIKNYLKNITILDLLLILSPFLDVFICLTQKFSSFSIVGTFIRGLLLVILLFYILVIKKEHNRLTSWYIVILMWYIVLFCSCTFFEKAPLFLEIKTLIKYMFYPLVLGGLILFNKKSKQLNKSLFICAIIYALLLVVPYIFHFNFASYHHGKAGNLGLFYSANEISAITSILCPFVFVNICSCKSIKSKIIHFIISCFYIYAIIGIGTKTTVLSCLIVSFLYLLFAIIRIIKKQSDKKQERINFILLFLLFTFSLIYFIFGNSLSNIVFQYDNYYKSAVGSRETITEEQVEKIDYDISDGNYNIIYNFSKNYSTVKTNKLLNLIFSSRDIFLKEKYQYYRNTPVHNQFLGIGQYYGNNEISKLVELDLFDIWFNYGFIGLIVYYSIIIYILVIVCKYFIRNLLKTMCDNDMYSKYTSVIITVLLSCLTGHVLGSPSTSFVAALVLSSLLIDIHNVKFIKKSFIDIKKIIIILISMAILVAAAFLIVKYDSRQYDYIVNINYNNGILEVNDSKYSIKKLDSETITSDFANDILYKYGVYCYDVKILDIIMVNRTFDNSITFNYITGKNSTKYKILVNIDNVNSYEDYYDFGNDEITKEYSTKFGYDKTTLPDKYLYNKTDGIYSIYYYNYIYSIQSVNYNKDNHSIIKVMNRKGKSIVKDNKVRSEIVLDNEDLFDSLIVDSNKELFNGNEINKYIELFLNNKTNAWLCFDGSYTKLPYSIEPFDRDAYGRNIGSEVEKRFIGMMDNELYKDYVYSSLHVIKLYLPSYPNSVWLSEYTSTWLSKYGIKALYVDTRHNDTISGYLLTLSNILNNKNLKEMAEYYAKYLINQYENDNFVHTSYGLLTPDYFSKNPEQKTHTSLNHQLSIINNLLTMYLETGKKEYKKVALELLSTVENIGKNWIKDNGDLHYQINIDETLSGEDYKTLTLDDLVNTQILLKKVGSNKSKVLNKLIASKYKYLVSIDYQIDDELTSKFKVGGYIE